jgi:hypothetical protein
VGSLFAAQQCQTKPRCAIENALNRLLEMPSLRDPVVSHVAFLIIKVSTLGTAAQRISKKSVFDAASRHHFAQHFPVELGRVSGVRMRAGVDQDLDAVIQEQLHEVTYIVIRVADAEDGWIHGGAADMLADVGIGFLHHQRPILASMITDASHKIESAFTGASMTLFKLSLCLSCLILLSACQSQDNRDSTTHSAPATKPSNFTGTLQSGVMAIGGEHTGWVLAGDGSSGGIEVDVSKVREAAKTNDGKRVTIDGKMVDKKYVERGNVKILVAEKITPAPAPKP